MACNIAKPGILTIGKELAYVEICRIYDWKIYVTVSVDVI